MASAQFGDVDILIAATALEHGLTIVTADADDTRVPDRSVLFLDRRTFTSLSERSERRVEADITMLFSASRLVQSPQRSIHSGGTPKRRFVA